MTTMPLAAEALPGEFEAAFDALMQQIKHVQERIEADQGETKRLMAEYDAARSKAHTSRPGEGSILSRIEEILGPHAAKTS